MATLPGGVCAAERGDGDEQSTWSTAFIRENELRTEIITAGRKRIPSYDLDGKLLWELNEHMSRLIIPSSFAAFEMVYLTSGYVGDTHRPVFAVKPGAAGDITLDKDQPANEFVRWYISAQK